LALASASKAVRFRKEPSPTERGVRRKDASETRTQRELACTLTYSVYPIEDVGART
jgi:hypothetical protein